MQKHITVLPGDGIGPEVTAQAVKVLKAVSERFGHSFIFKEALFGACAIEKTGNPLPDETLALCKKADAILLGAIGDPKYDNNPKATVRPEQGLLRLRKELGLYANIRPVKSRKVTEDISPLKPEIVRGTDMVIFRELTGGIYFGEKHSDPVNGTATDTCTYTRGEIQRVAVLAFKTALQRRKKLTLIDKANVLETSRLWRSTVSEIAKKFPEVKVDYQFVDSAAMKLIQQPREFDVILTENMFGDILSDEASVLAGSLGMLPSASIGESGSLYEPIHGSFPQAAGKNIANPVGAILSAAMMLEYSFGMDTEAQYIEKTVIKAMEEGFVTQDISPADYCNTSEVGDRIAAAIGREMFEGVL